MALLDPGLAFGTHLRSQLVDLVHDVRQDKYRSQTKGGMMILDCPV
jgi:hypothetical protein